MSASRTAALAPAQDTIPPDPRNPSDGRVFLLDVPFHQQKTAQQAGAQHDENLRCWAWRGSILPQSLVPFRPPPLSYERYREDDINGARWAPGIPRENIVLREHQADGVSAILAARRAGRCGMLLADDVGLGKTYTAWKAVAAMPDKSAARSGRSAVEAMKAMPTDDALFGKGSIRIDGRKIHDMYLFEVKSPSESKQPYDYYDVVSTIPGDQAFRPLKDSGCPLVGSAAAGR